MQPNSMSTIIASEISHSEAELWVEGASFFTQASFSHCVALIVEFLHNCILAKMMQAWWDGSEVKAIRSVFAGQLASSSHPHARKAANQLILFCFVLSEWNLLV